MEEIRFWWIRNFMTISNEKAKSMKLKHYMNFREPSHDIYKSLWKDSKNRKYFGSEFA